MLAALVDSLHFKDDFQNAIPFIQTHLSLVQKNLIQFVATEPLVDNRIRAGLAELSEENQMRLITSPYVCELLMLIHENQDAETTRPFRQQLVQGLVAEIKRADTNFAYPLEPRWTFNGDTVLDSELQKQFPPLQTDCGISLNYQSYIHNTGKDGIGGYDLTMALQHKERIETAKQIISQVSAAALSMVDLFTTVIQFRHNENRPNVVNSSTHTSIGLIRCDNFHKLHADLAEVVDMLVHESIHQYLHLFEEQVFEFVDTRKIPSDQILLRQFPSPWSGNLLDIRSYTHAILVWFGLGHFWQQYLDSGLIHPEIDRFQAQEKLKEAQVGFINSNSVLDNLAGHAGCLAPEYVQQIVLLQNMFKSRIAV